MLENADRNRFAGMLKGKRVVIGITASISLYRVPDLVRDVRREGAEVIVGMSREASDLVSPEILKWASGNEVVSKLTGSIEHITLFKGQREDVSYAIVPCTHNTMGKIANGISDDVPSAMYSFAVGNGNRVVIAPAMHEGMYRNPANIRNTEFLESAGVDIVPPQISEEKAKLSANDEILDHICRSFHSGFLEGKKVLIVGGHTEEPVDPVRSVSNRGTGFTAYWFARTAFRLGALTVTYVGNCTEDLPSYVNYLDAKSSDEMEKLVISEARKGYDLMLFPAAISDFTIKDGHKEKIDSSSTYQITLKPRSKIIEEVRKVHSGILIPFNLTDGKNIDQIRKKFKKSVPDAIISNTFAKRSPFGETFNDYEVITESSVEKLEDVSKPEMTVQVLKLASEMLSKKR